ncbi:MAG: ADP-ribosylglycohydrolase family protein [Actinomycetota bacterium]
MQSQWGQVAATNELRYLSAYPPSWELSSDHPDSAQLNCQSRLKVYGPRGLQLAFICAKSLIEHQGVELQDWRKVREVWEQNEAGESDAKQLGVSSPYPFHPATPILAALPVALFFHEDPVKLRQKLQQLADIWQNSNELSDGFFAVGYAIAQALQHKLNPVALIPQIITYLEEDTALVALLVQVQIMLEQAASLEVAVTQLYKQAIAAAEKQNLISASHSIRSPATQLNQRVASSLPIALAFYSFLKTPEDLRLAVVRAARSGIEPRLTCALTGTLSGAYNSTAALPAGWRRLLAGKGKSPSAQEEPILSHQLTEAQIKTLTANLLAVWSGVCNGHQVEFPLDLIVSAPRVIRPHRFESGGDLR